MKEDQPSAGQRSWFERMSQALSGEPRDRPELLELLRDLQQRGLYDAEAEAMLEGVLQVSEMQVRDIMIPRPQMITVPRDVPPRELLPIVVESGHSRFPVLGEDRDEVVGILLAKDLLRYCADGGEQSVNIREVLRRAVFVPESKRLNVLLREFRASRNHLAIVVDEYGGVSGMVTIEDVLEQIVGEIEDEHDIDEDPSIRQHGDGRYIVKALTPVADFNAHFGAALDTAQFDTVGGLVLGQFGRMPARGESAELDGFRFRVLRADSRRIHLLEVVPPVAGSA